MGLDEIVRFIGRLYIILLLLNFIRSLTRFHLKKLNYYVIILNYRINSELFLNPINVEF